MSLLTDSREASGENLNHTTPHVYKAGIIGLGWIATKAPDNHMKAYLENKRTELIALCDTDIWRIPWGYQEYTDYREMGRLDIVSVCTPVSTHAEIVCDIAPLVKAIYCEKPMATTLEECDRMIVACEEAKTLLFINHQRHFTQPKFRFSRDLINTGTHVFDLLTKLFGQCTTLLPIGGKFGNTWVDIEYTPSDENIFELDCMHTKESMIPLGVQHIVDCLDGRVIPVSTGRDGREALKLALEFKKEVYLNEA